MGGDFSMLDAAGQALLILLDPTRFMYLVGGVLMGLCIGILPGIGGLTGFALLLPFTFTMDPYTAYAILLGMLAVGNTSDTIPAVLLGVPGSSSAQATVLDGLQMTRNGEAGRALAAAYISSMLGGVFGALVLALALPVVRPVVLAVGTPEMLAISVMAIAMVASLSGKAPLRGMVVACFGIMVAMIGSAPQTGTLRWTFDSLYLWDGLPLLPIILGLYALPELCDLAIRRGAQFDGKPIDVRSGMFRGAKDAISNWFLIVRCSGMGAAIGAIPGLSGSIVDWLAYGHALNTVKGARQSFGKGDVRGVIAPESANNATEGGSLLPTLAFGVPGSASMALLIGALMIHGVTPGPDMLTKHLPLTYSMMWSVALANIVGAGILFAFSGQFARLALLRFSLILPAILIIVYIGAFQGSRNWGDLFALLFFGMLGWGMKTLRWPRPPLILGFVLGPLIERYMSVSIARYGADWLLRPIVVIFLLLGLIVLARPLFTELRKSGGAALRLGRPTFRAPDLVYVGFIAVALAMLAQAQDWPRRAMIGPVVVVTTAIVFAVIGLLNQVFVARRLGARQSDTLHMDLVEDMSDLSTATLIGRAGRFFAWLVAFMASLWLIGAILTIPLFIVAFMRIENRERWTTCLIYAAAMTGAVYVVFDQLLHIAWPRTWLAVTFPGLRGVIPTL